jgi:hypothetical protein
MGIEQLASSRHVGARPLHAVVASVLLFGVACDPDTRTVAPYQAQTDGTLETRRQEADLDAALCPPDDLECRQLASQERIAAEQRQEMRNEGAETRKMMEGQHAERLQLDREKQLEGEWFCFEGEADGRSAGACRKNQEECIDAATRAVDAGLGGNVGCRRQRDVICYGASRALDAERVVRCFPSTESCERHHAQLEAKPGWSELSECLPLN